MSTSCFMKKAISLRVSAALFLVISVLLSCTVAAEPPRPVLQPLRHGGAWPPFPTAPAQFVQLIGGYAYVTLGAKGLAIFDIHNISNIVQVGSHPASDFSFDL